MKKQLSASLLIFFFTIQITTPSFAQSMNAQSEKQALAKCLNSLYTKTQTSISNYVGEKVQYTTDSKLLFLQSSTLLVLMLGDESTSESNTNIEGSVSSSEKNSLYTGFSVVGALISFFGILTSRTIDKPFFENFQNVFDGIVNESPRYLENKNHSLSRHSLKKIPVCWSNNIHNLNDLERDIVSLKNNYKANFIGFTIAASIFTIATVYFATKTPKSLENEKRKISFNNTDEFKAAVLSAKTESEIYDVIFSDGDAITTRIRKRHLANCQKVLTQDFTPTLDHLSSLTNDDVLKVKTLFQENRM